MRRIRDMGQRGATRVAGATGIVLSALLVVTGCSTPVDTRQARIDNPSRPNSVNAASGAIRLLATRVEAPDELVHLQGGNVGLYTTLANDGTSVERLLGVSTVYAREVVQRTGTDGVAGPVGVDIPPGRAVSLQYPGGLHLELVDLKVDVAGSRFVPVTFRFTNGSVTVDVFVEGFGFPTVSPLTPTTG